MATDAALDAIAQLPFDTLVRVLNLDNGRAVAVRINDRGPFCKQRVIDLSLGAARAIGMVELGTANVRIDIVKPPPPGVIPGVRRY